MTEPDFLSTAAAATLLGVTPQRIRQLCASGRLPARKLGRDWFIERAAAETYRPRPEGRPKKERRRGRPRKAQE